MDALQVAVSDGGRDGRRRLREQPGEASRVSATDRFARCARSFACGVEPMKSRHCSSQVMIGSTLSAVCSCSSRSFTIGCLLHAVLSRFNTKSACRHRIANSSRSPAACLFADRRLQPRDAALAHDAAAGGDSTTEPVHDDVRERPAQPAVLGVNEPRIAAPSTAAPTAHATHRLQRFGAAQQHPPSHARLSEQPQTLQSSAPASRSGRRAASSDSPPRPRRGSRRCRPASSAARSSRRTPASLVDVVVIDVISPSSSSSRSSSGSSSSSSSSTVRLVHLPAPFVSCRGAPPPRGYGDLVQFSRRCASPCLTRRFLNAFTRR